MDFKNVGAMSAYTSAISVSTR